MSTYKGSRWAEYSLREAHYVVEWLNGKDHPLTDMVPPELDPALGRGVRRNWEKCSGPCCRQKHV